MKPHSELGFLYKKTTFRPSIISRIQYIPEYTEALLNDTRSLNDQLVYEILKKTYKQMCSDGKYYPSARGILNQISKDVMGDSSAWQND